MSRIDILTLALAVAEEEVSYDITIRGMSRESFDKMPGDDESAGPCGNPECDCTVWEKYLDFGDDGVMTFNTTEQPTLGVVS
jgi:hypothetical protein